MNEDLGIYTTALNSERSQAAGIRMQEYFYFPFCFCEDDKGRRSNL